MKPLVNYSGSNGNPLYAIPSPDYVSARVLAAGVAESITVPAGAKFVVFSADADFYCAYSGTAVVAADNDAGTADELNPVARRLDSDDTISVISAAACNLTASFYE